MEFLDENNFPYLLSLIKLRQFPLRRRRVPVVQIWVGKCQGTSRWAPVALTYPHSPPLRASPCLCSWQVGGFTLARGTGELDARMQIPW